MVEARAFLDEFGTAIRTADADRYASLYADDAVMIEPLASHCTRKTRFAQERPPCLTLSGTSSRTSGQSCPTVRRLPSKW